MNTYFSTFISGAEKPIKHALQSEIRDVVIITILDGAVLYKAHNKWDSKIKQLKFFNNTFLIISFLKNSSKSSLAKLVDKSKSMLTANSFQLPKRIKTFRLVTSDQNQLIKLDDRFYRVLTPLITHKFRLTLSLRKADVEFWIIIRSESLILFGIRLTKRRWSKDKLDPGSLPTEISYLLCLLSDPEKNDTVLDPMAGSGSIIIERHYGWRASQIIAGDLDEKILKKMTHRLHVGNIRQVDVKLLDATNMPSISDLSISKIITDPPWGHYKKEYTDIKSFYIQMLKELYRVLQPNGEVVILMSRDNQFEEAINSNKFKILMSLDILHSGHKARILKLKKIVY